MARVLRLSALIWRSPAGLWGGHLLDDGRGGYVCAASPQEAQQKLKEYVQARDASGELLWLNSPDYGKPELRVVKIEVRPEYRTGAAGDQPERSWPCQEKVLLRLPAVVARNEDGQIAVTLPTVDVQFHVAETGMVEEMARHYVHSELQESTPSDLLRFLPPEEYRLVEITHTPKGRDEQKEKIRTPALVAVSDPASSPLLRKTAKTWERDQDVAALERRLREPHTSILLTGESGCGKSAILLEAARRIERTREDRKTQAAARFRVSSGARLIAGMRWLGQWQERLEQVVAELRSIDGVLCIENLRELLSLGGNSPEASLAAFLLPYLRSGELRMIAEATPAEVEACERQLPGLLDVLRIQRIDPLPASARERLLDRAAEFFSANGALDFTPEAAREADRLTRRFLPGSAFPGGALDLLADAQHRALESGNGRVMAPDIRLAFSAQAGVSEELLDDSRRILPAELTAWFSDRLVGQPQALDAVSRIVMKLKTGLNDPERPLGALLFTGPTGTGKTQLARLLGDRLFPERPAAERLIRLDMSEYAGSGALTRLLGDPWGEPSELVRRIRRQPLSILLLDEVEKAAPEIFDALMGVFDEGRLTDALGRTTWFRSTVIIMTSNLGVSRGSALGFGNSGMTRPSVDLAAVHAFFRPEFFNRLDQLVAFNALGRAEVEQIARRELEAVAERQGFRDRGISLTFTAELVQAVAEQGFDPLLGARPLQRRIEELIITPLAHHLAGLPPDGTGRTIAVGWEAGRAVFRISAA